MHKLSFSITDGNNNFAETGIMINITPLKLNTKVPKDYAFEFKASTLSTNKSALEWQSNGVTAEFEDFDWINGGIINEKDGVDGLGSKQCLRIKAGSSMTIKYPLLNRSAKSSGKNFKIIFKIKNSRNMDATFLHCKKLRRAAFSDTGNEIIPNIPEGTTLTWANNVNVYDDYSCDLKNPFEKELYMDDKDCRDALENKYVKYKNKIYRCRFKEIETLEDSFYVELTPVIVRDTFTGLDMTVSGANFNSLLNSLIFI